MKKSQFIGLIILVFFVATTICSNSACSLMVPVDPEPEPEIVEAPAEEILSDFQADIGSNEAQEEKEGLDPSANEFEAPDTSEQIMEQFGE